MKYEIQGVDVEFPFEAYPCQVNFMEANIRALSTPTNAILESPTGTGKTLCLLCSTIAYQKHLRVKEGKTFRIFYSSRTHAQLTQVIKELRGTSYHDEVRTAVLASRDHLCVEPVVNQNRGAILNSQCRRLVKNKACTYANKVARGSSFEAAPTVANCGDIEDLYRLGSVKGFCSFYQSRESVKSADIVFVPYNYIVDLKESTEESQSGMDLTGAVVIIDEAHNIERVCEDAASMTFGTLDIFHSIKLLERSMLAIQEDRQVRTNGDERREQMTEVQQMNDSEKRMEELIAVLRNVEHLLSKFDLTEIDSNGRREKGVTGQDVLGIFITSGCHKGNYKAHLQTAEEAQERILEDTASTFASACMQNFKDVLALLFGVVESGSDVDDNFRAFVQVGDTRAGGNASDLANARVISMFCLSAAVAMRGLVGKKKVRSVVLASGTLSPLGLLQQSMGIPFGVVLENTHVIDPAKQVRFGVVCAGPNRQPLNASYQNKANVEYINDLGNLVVNVARVTPEGALLVFHSYSQMSAVIRVWTDNGIYARINREKTIFVEPRNAGELTDVLKNFQSTTLSNSGGALLICVCRGKVTEGVDLSDNQCRLVMMAGVPFPAVQDRKVNLKRDFLDSKNRGDGSKWYIQEASRAVNQTIGRTIRHRKDYGAILLLDERCRSYTGNDLPGWVKGHVKTYPQFGPVIKDLSDFFKNLPTELLNRTSTRTLQRNNSLNFIGGHDTTGKQIESIEKLISSVPIQKILPAPSSLPLTRSSFENSFKIAAPAPLRPLARIPTADASAVPQSQSATSNPALWIKRMKSVLSRKDYLLLKQQLRRLLEGAHGECDITVTESLLHLRELLRRANMLETFEPSVAGSNSFLRARWSSLAGL